MSNEKSNSGTQKRPTLDELETFFDNYFKEKSHIAPIRLNDESLITNPVKFYKAHLAFLKCHRGNKLYLPYYERLFKVFNLLNVPENEKSDTQK